MKRFFCPYCNYELTVLDGTLFKLKGVLQSDFFDCTAMFHLPAEPGKYGSIVEPHVVVKEGAKVVFHCPDCKCNHNFTTHYDDNLAEVKMLDEDGTEYVAVFSCIHGKHATFLISYTEKTIQETFGEDVDEYIHDFDDEINFFW